MNWRCHRMTVTAWHNSLPLNLMTSVTNLNIGWSYSLISWLNSSWQSFSWWLLGFFFPWASILPILNGMTVISWATMRKSARNSESFKREESQEQSQRQRIWNQMSRACNPRETKRFFVTFRRFLWIWPTVQALICLSFPFQINNITVGKESSRPFILL